MNAEFMKSESEIGSGLEFNSGEYCSGLAQNGNNSNIKLKYLKIPPYIDMKIPESRVMELANRCWLVRGIENIFFIFKCIFTDKLFF